MKKAAKKKAKPVKKAPPALPQEAAATWEPTDSLTEWTTNPRLNDHAVKKVAKSIGRFGFLSPIIARSETREIIAGHTRFKAAQLLGLEKVPVRFLDLSEGEARILALADNRIGEVATWDKEALTKLLEGIDADDLSATGFEDTELDRFLDGIFEKPAKATDDTDGDDPAIPRTPGGQAIKPLTIFFEKADFDEVVKGLCDILDGQGITSNAKALLWLVETYRP